MLLIQSPPLLQIEGFNGSLFADIDSYKAERLAAADDLRRRVAMTRALGDLLTGDTIARGCAAIQCVDVRNQTPLFPPLFLTFLENPS